MMPVQIDSHDIHEKSNEWMRRAQDVLQREYPDASTYPLHYNRRIPILFDVDDPESDFAKDPDYGIVQIVFELMYQPGEGPNGEDKWFACSDVKIFGDKRPVLNLKEPAQRRGKPKDSDDKGPRIQVIGSSGETRSVPLPPEMDKSEPAKENVEQQRALDAVNALDLEDSISQEMVDGYLQANDRHSLLQLCRDVGIDVTDRTRASSAHKRLTAFISLQE